MGLEPTYYGFAIRSVTNSGHPTIFAIVKHTLGYACAAYLLKVEHANALNYYSRIFQLVLPS